MLRAAGCEVVQGYLFGRPAPLKIENGVTHAGVRRAEGCGERSLSDRRLPFAATKTLKAPSLGELPILGERARPASCS